MTESFSDSPSSSVAEETIIDVGESESTALSPLDVRVIGEVEHAGKDFTSWYTYFTQGATDTPQRIAPLDRHRDRMTVMIRPGVAGNVTGYLLMGSRGQVMNGQGAQLINGDSFVCEGVQETWIMSDGTNSLKAVVIIDRYAGM